MMQQKHQGHCCHRQNRVSAAQDGDLQGLEDGKACVPVQLGRAVLAQRLVQRGLVLRTRGTCLSPALLSSVLTCILVCVQNPRRLMVNLQQFFAAHKIPVEETMFWSGNDTAGAE